MNVCKRCLMPEGKFDVLLNEEGVCNYCTYYDSFKAGFSDYVRLKAHFDKRINDVRGKYEFDAVVGISGGKDSSYILNTLVKDYKLNVLAVTYENGFLSDIAKENIKKIVNSLGVTHRFYYPDWDVHKKLYQSAVEKKGDPCLACAFSGYFLALKFCGENRVPFFIHGRSPYQMFRNFFPESQDIFIPMIKGNLAEHSFTTIAGLYKPILKKMQQMLFLLCGSESDAQIILKEFYPGEDLFTDEFSPEFLSYFLFEKYDEKKIKQTIIQELGYRDLQADVQLTHQDCDIHDVSAHLYKTMFGVELIAPEVAVMLRREEITKAQAKTILESAVLSDERIKKSLHCLCQRLEYDAESMQKIITGLKNSVIEKFDSR